MKALCLPQIPSQGESIARPMAYNRLIIPTPEASVLFTTETHPTRSSQCYLLAFVDRMIAVRIYLKTILGLPALVYTKITSQLSDVLHSAKIGSGVKSIGMDNSSF